MIPDNTYQPDKRWLIPKTSDSLILGGLGMVSGMLLSEMNARGLKKTAATALKDIEQSLAHALPIEPLSMDTLKTGGVLYRQEGWVKHPLFMTFLMPFVHPELAPAALAYAVALGGVFVGSNVFQGIQESWVRWEESCIRANLVHGLQSAFKQSIQTKLQSDAQLRTETRETLNRLFPEVRTSTPTPKPMESPVSLPLHLSSLPRVPEQQDAEFVYMPFNRDKPFLHPPVSPSPLSLPLRSVAPRSAETPALIRSNACSTPSLATGRTPPPPTR